MAELNPVLVKELRGRMRGARAFLLLTGYLVILGGVTLLLYIAVAGSSGNSFDAGRRIGLVLFNVIAAVALIEVCIITPSLTAGGIAGEKERQTFDLLIASQLSPWQILWGKLGSALAFAALLIAAIVPLMSLAFLFGGVSLAELVIALVGMLVTALCYASVGLFWSTVMRSTLGANSFALASVIAWQLGVPFIAVIGGILFASSGSSWDDSAALVHAGVLLLSTHPFIAMGMTETFVREGQGVVINQITLGGGAAITSLSPWLWYTLFSLLVSAGLLAWSARLLRARTTRPPAPPPASAAKPQG